MAKQTFTTGQVLLASQLTSLQQTALGGGAASAKVASYTLVAADAGTAISMTNASATTITVNTGLFSAGDTVLIQNLGAGVCTVTAGSATVNTAGSLALAQYEAGVLYFVSASAAILFDYTQTGAASPLTTKGDLYGFSTLDARIPIGANATVLTADSNEALGLKWAAPASGSTFVGCSVRGASTLIANNTITVLDYTIETFDTSDFHSNTTNPSRITIPAGKAGYYLIIAKVEWNTNAGGNNRQVRLNLNGTNIKTNVMAPDGDSPGPQVQTVRNLAVNDFLTVSVFQDSGADLECFPTATQEFSVAFIGAA